MRILAVAGEASGDAHAAKVVRLLVARGATVTAVGGDQMAAAGATLLAHVDDIAVLGFVEVLRRLRRFQALERDLGRRLHQHEFDLFLPVDFPGLNLRLATRAHRAGVPVLYYIGPQVWAWGAGRLRRLRRDVALVALILPFEKPQYDAAGVPATFVGHPLLDDADVEDQPPDVDVGLFPGSRDQEVRRHLPVLLDAGARLRRRHPDTRFLVSVAPTAPAGWMRDTVQAAGLAAVAELVAEPARVAMRRARVLLVASGTATLEAALAARPFAVFYRTGRINFALARHLVRVPHIALANLVAGKEVVREYVQANATPAALAAELERLLFDTAACRAQLQALAAVRERLGNAGASARVADLALELARGAAVEVPTP